MSESVRSIDMPPETRTRRRGRWIAAIVVVLVLLVVVPPFISLNRFRRTIVHSISAGLGRSVEASSVELQLFPRPGFVLHNLRVGEDPAFGAEPVMMADTVTAGLRASTLWHRRVEIATLKFDAPSVNLVRDADGHWNFESLLRNSPALHGHGSVVASRSGNRLPFPYVEATEARINFKLGAEKLPLSLERANLAVWQDSPHVWRMRIRANPVRTDLSVEDSGQIRGEGRLLTGGELMNAPVRASLEWRRVELGDISRLLHGEDDGWRGTVDWTALAQGTLADVVVTSDIAVEEFRRAEFMPVNEMDLSAHCQARYARNHAALDSLACNAPVEGGHLWLRGFGALPTTSATPVPYGGKVRKHTTEPGSRLRAGDQETSPGSRIEIALQKIPAQFFLDLLGHVHPGVAPDASASGEVNGRADCLWQGLHIPTACTGEVRAPELRLQLAHLDRPLRLSPLVLAAASEENSPTLWRLEPVHVSLGGETAATIAGTAGSGNVALQVTGPADLTEMGRLAQSLRIPAFSGEVQSVRGSAQLGLTLTSNWLAGQDNSDLPGTAAISLSPSQWTGSVQLRDATLKLAALPVPIELASGRIDLTPAGIEWTALNGTFARIPFDGSIEWQTPCPTANSACARSFTLHTANLNAGHLQAALHGSAGGLFDLINPFAEDVPRLPKISGTFRADVLSAGRISLKDAILQLQLQGESAQLQSISGRIFGGTISSAPSGADSRGAGSARWGDGAPAYTLHVDLNRIQPDNVGAIWHERWGGGVADAKIDLKTQGWSAAELAGNAGGKFSVDWRNGMFPPAAEETNTPSLGKFDRWTAKGIVQSRTLVLDSSRMVPQIAPQRQGLVKPVTQSVTGTVTFGRALDLHLAPSGISIGGTLSAPPVQSPQ